MSPSRLAPAIPIRSAALAAALAATLAFLTALPLAAQTVDWTARKGGPLVDGEARPGSGDAIRGKRALAVDGGGNVYVTGYSSNGSNDDYLTVAYDANGTELWAKVRNGAANNQDRAYALAVDGSGNVYVTGHSFNGSNNDYLTVAYDASGTELWAKVKNGAANDQDYAYALAVDSSGNVYVTGYSFNGSNYDFLTVAYDASGTELWAKVKNGAANSTDQAYALAVGGNGNVYLTGSSFNGSNSDFLTVAYDASGTELWARVKHLAANSNDQAHALTVDASGSVYVTGQSFNGSNYDFLTVAYDASGTELWAKVKSGATNNQDQAFALAVGGSGNVYVTGQSFNGSNYDFLTVAYDASGTELWAKVKNGAANSTDQAYALAVGGNGNVYLTGSSFNGSYFDFLTVAYDASGTELWAKVKNGAANSTDQAYALAVGGNGNVYVTGYSWNGSNHDYLTVAYDASGTELWARKEPPTAWPADRPGNGETVFGKRALMVGGGGDVFVAGSTYNGANSDFLTVAYDANGNELWARVKNGVANGHDAAHALAVDASGNVYVTGFSSNGANDDYLTVAYDASGTELWARVKNGAANNQDQAYALAASASGGVYVTGKSNNGSNFDYLTVAYDASGTELWSKVKNGAANGEDLAFALTVAASGNVYATGRSPNGSNEDFLTVAYDPDGNELWAKVKNGAGNGSDLGFALAADGSGGVYVTGASYNGSDNDCLTVAYDASGTELWSKVKNGAANGHDIAYALAVDGSGNVYVTGRSFNGSSDDYVTVAYDANGNELWAKVKNGAANGQDYAYALAVDGSGNIYVTGYSWNGSNHDYLTVAYDASGTELWALPIDEGFNDLSYAIALDGVGGVIVSGYSDAPSADFFTVRIATAGDTTPPADPTIDSTSPLAGSWSSDDTVEVSWSGAADEPGGTGLAGYSFEWNQTAVSTPDATVDLAHGADPHSTISPPLADADDWYFHLRTCDVAGNCTATVHAGPFWIDTAPPSAPASPGSGSHVAGVVSELDTIEATWSPATDEGAGIDGYSWAFTGTSSWTCETTKDGEEGVNSTSSGPLAAGAWYFHVCARDAAGNWGAAATAGPFLVTGTSLPETCELSFERKWGAFGVGPGEFRRPFGVGASTGVGVAVADLDNGRLQLFDASGDFLRQWSTTGAPVSVAVDSHGHVVVSILSGFVRMYDADGVLANQWTTGHPYGLTVDATDHFYVVDDTGKVVTKYDHAGNFVLQFGGSGSGDGQFFRPWGVATGPGGDVFVTDINAHHVQRFTSGGAFVAKWGSFGTGLGQLNAPTGVAVSPGGVVYVAESGNERIQAFTLEGFPLCAWGGPGTGDGQFAQPLNLAYDGGRLYVADQLNHRIQEFGADVVAPIDPAIVSTAPLANTWSSDATVEVGWSGAADEAGGSGLAGYSIEWNQTPVSTPDATVDVAHATDPHSATSAALTPDGNDWYFHLSSCDVAGNCTATVHAGPFWIDSTPPGAPATVASSSHDGGAPSADATIDLAWGAASDATSGVAAYRYGFAGSAIPPACAALADTTAGTSATSAALADGAWYAHVCAVDAAGNEGPLASGGPFSIDTTPPSGLVVTSTSHAVSTWSNDATIDFGFGGATDAGGLAGYAVAFDTTAGTVPACASTQAGTTYVGSASPDGDSWWIHVRAVDAAGNCGDAVHLGPFWIDTAAPSAPGAVVSSSHDGGPTNEPTIDVEWGAASDGSGSGVDGFSYIFSGGDDEDCDGTAELDESERAASSPPLAAGTWYVHVCAVDRAGNWSPVTTGGPYMVDLSAPEVANLDSVASSGGSIGEGEVVNVEITELLVVFDEAMDLTLAETLSNYLLVEAGSDGLLETADCSGVASSDVAVAIDTATYAGTITTLGLNGGLALSDGLYRLLACPALEDIAGNALDGNGDGVGGDAFVRSIRVDLSPPSVVEVDSVADTGDGQVAENEATNGAITELHVTFDEAMVEAAAESSSEWALVGSGSGSFETLDCAGGVQGDDLAVAIDQVIWDEPTLTATLEVNGGVALSDGLYRLYACTTLTDLSGNGLDGDGDGASGDDFARTFLVDTVPPENPTAIASSTHPYLGWSSSTAFTAQWSGASDDFSGLAGYSVVIDGSPSSAVDDTVEAADGSGAGSHSTTLGEGAWYVHVRSCDNAGNCAVGVAEAGFWGLDTTAPGAPGAVTSTSHDGGAATSDATIEVAWSAATDATSGVAHYRHGFTGSATAPACGTLAETTTGTSSTSAALADGTWYAHVCAVDEAGNEGPSVTGGPYLIDTSAPKVSGVDSVASHGGSIEEGESVNVAVTELLVVFDEAMAAAGAETLGNYLLIEAGSDGVLDSADCALGGDDLGIAVDSATYAGTTSTLGINGSVALPDGLYRLFACAGLVDLAGNALDGDGDGTGGDAFGRTFRVDTVAPAVVAMRIADDGQPLASGLRTRATVTGIEVDFDEVLRDPPGDGGVGDVDSAASYRLLFDAAGAFEIDVCSDVDPGDDLPIPVDDVVWSGGARRATLALNGGAALGDGWYRFVVCGALADLAGNPLTAEPTVDFQIDRQPPALPSSLVSSSHAPFAWSTLETLGLAWSGAADEPGGSGLSHYALAVDMLPAATPDGSWTVAHGSDPHGAAAGPLGGGSWYAHLLACDTAGNCAGPLHAGPYLIDLAGPEPPLAVASPSHDGGPSSDPTIEVAWLPASDDASGLAGYAWHFSSLPSWSCDEVEDGDEASSSATSSALGEGDWYFHLCARDNAGNWGTAGAYGPWTIDATRPTVAAIDSVAAADWSGGGAAVVDAALTQLLVAFGEEMATSGPGSVLETGNWRLVEAGPDGVVDTGDCDGLADDDVAAALPAVQYDAGLGVAAVAVGAGSGLPAGSYRILACPALTDVAGNGLDGAGDGGGAEAYARDFTVTASRRLVNPNFDAGLESWWAAGPVPEDWTWSAVDAEGKPFSGAARLATAAGAGATWYLEQCVETIEPGAHGISARSRIASAEPGAPTLRAFLTWMDGAGCGGTGVAFDSSPFLSGDSSGNWLGLAVSPADPPPGAASFWLTFEVVGGAAESYTVEIDRALYPDAWSIFTDDFETGAPCRWAGVVGGEACP